MRQSVRNMCSIYDTTPSVVALMDDSTRERKSDFLIRGFRRIGWNTAFQEEVLWESLDEVPLDLLLVRWVNMNLREMKVSRRVENLGNNLRDSYVLACLGRHLLQLDIDVDELMAIQEDEARAKLMLKRLEAGLEHIGPPPTVEDIIFENKDNNCRFFVTLMLARPNLKPDPKPSDALKKDVAVLSHIVKGELGFSLETLDGVAQCEKHLCVMISDADELYKCVTNSHQAWLLLALRNREWSAKLTAMRLHGFPETILDEASRREYFDFTTIRLEKIQLLDPKEEDPQRVQNELIALLTSQFETISQVFRSFAGAEGNVNSMTSTGYLNFVGDSGLLHHVSREEVLDIFSEANEDAIVEKVETKMGVREDIRKIDVPENPEEALTVEAAVENDDNELVPYEFVDCLLRLAALR
jgi:hypothetical protein